MNYLGIDFGTTGVSAVLLNQTTGEKYPLYWRNEVTKIKSQFVPRSAEAVMFRLPTIAYSGTAVSEVFCEPQVASVIVGSVASTLAKAPGIYLQHFKPYLKLAIPYYAQESHEWEPTLQLPGQSSVSLYWVRRALQAILTTLTPASTHPNAVLQVGAVGLEPEALAAALSELAGVILGCPAHWGDTYRINLREAVLEAKLVQEPRQIFCLEDAIATLLTTLPNPHRSVSPSVASSPASKATPWGGTTLAINIGATTTELAIVTLPDPLQELTHQDFQLWSWPYGGYALDQDIVWQLLYPQLSEAQKQQLTLGAEVTVPLLNHPDPMNRDRALSVLLNSAFGQALLKAAGYLKVILQHKDQFVLNLGTDQWTIQRRDLETQVIFPFVEQVNREVNALLIKTGLSQQGITQVICQGGSTAFPILKRWLEQKLPNATLLQETDLPPETWVASGLASLALYPHVLNDSQQQYSDYFLLLEVLRAFAESKDDSPFHAYSLKEIMQKLERRGLNTTACSERLIALIEGHFPPGLIPSIDYPTWLSPTSQANLHYSRLSTGKIFEREGEGFYRPNRQQQAYLRQYLETLFYSTFQSFEDPLIVNLGSPL